MPNIPIGYEQYATSLMFHTKNRHPDWSYDQIYNDVLTRVNKKKLDNEDAEAVRYEIIHYPEQYRVLFRETCSRFRKEYPDVPMKRLIVNAKRVVATKIKELEKEEARKRSADSIIAREHPDLFKQQYEIAKRQYRGLLEKDIVEIAEQQTAYRVECEAKHINPLKNPIKNRVHESRLIAFATVIAMSLVLYVASPLIKLIAGCAICDWGADDFPEFIAEVMCTMINPFFWIMVFGVVIISGVCYMCLKSIITGKE